MQQLPPRVQLVELSLDQSPVVLRNRLADWGVDVARYPAADWLHDEDRSPWPAVLWMGHRPMTDRSSLSERILNRSRKPSLAVFDGGLAADDHLLCASCSDFVRWPAEEEELRVRLSRLWPGSPPGEGGLDVPMVGESPAMQAIRRTSAQFAALDVPVLITGETGTGKELAARTIHYLGGRREGPFIPVNCGAIPPELIENELFGHQRGAYTDARAGQSSTLR